LNHRGTEDTEKTKDNERIKKLTRGKTVDTEDPLTGEVIGAAIEVHRLMGPGLLESVYQVCLEEELRLRGIEHQPQAPLPLV
jgi:hypothetical protein